MNDVLKGTLSPFRTKVILLLTCIIFFIENICEDNIYLIPIPPLDGSHIFAAYIPDKAMEFLGRYRVIGYAAFFLVIATPIFDTILSIPIAITWLLLEAVLAVFGLSF